MSWNLTIEGMIIPSFIIVEYMEHLKEKSWPKQPNPIYE